MKIKTLYEKIQYKIAELTLLGSQFSFDPEDQKRINRRFARASRDLDYLYNQRH